jgi:hypothetical protein
LRGRERASASELPNRGLPQRPHQISVHPLSAVVVRTDTRRSGKGFEEMARLLRVPGRSSPQAF